MQNMPIKHHLLKLRNVLIVFWFPLKHLFIRNQHQRSERKNLTNDSCETNERIYSDLDDYGVNNRN